MVRPLFADREEAEAAIERKRGIEFFHVDGHRLAGAGGFIEQVGKKRCSKSSPAMLGKERDVDNAMLGLPAREIEPANRCSGMLDDKEIGARIVLLIMRMLRVELRLQECGLLRVGPIGYGEFFRPRQSIKLREERQVSLGGGTKRETRGSCARPAKWRARAFAFIHVRRRR